MLCAESFNENALTTNLTPFPFSRFAILLLRYTKHQAEVTRPSVSLLNVKFVGVLSAVTVITPNQYSADGCQRETVPPHLTSPRLTLAGNDTGNYPTIRRGEKARSVAGSLTEFSKGGGAARGPGGWATGSDWEIANNCGHVRWTGERTGGRNVLNKSRR